MFEPIRTERLLLRVPRAADVDVIHGYRNDPRVAQYETWTLPLAHDKVAAVMQRSIDSGVPVDDVFFNLAVADPADTIVLGDAGIKLGWGGRSAEIGYTLAPEHWGNGYATEIAAALVAHLWARPEMTRVHAMLHPDNLASARVLERTGFLFEGHTRLSFWVGDDNSDDWLYGMTRDDWRAWVERRVEPAHEVRLVEVDATNVRAVGRLAVHKTQERMVSSVLQSFGDAHFPEVVDGVPLRAWMRAVEADGELVGFVMLELAPGDHPEPYLWRLLVDRRHQRRGIGRRVLDLVVERLRSDGASGLLVSWTEGAGSPGPFYESYGFERTGRVVDGETEARLDLGRSAT